MSSTPTAWDIYKGALYGLHYGHALWEPSPIYSYQRVKPGYVGYIRDGGFHLLFDAGAELGSGERNDSLPQNFERLEVGPIKRRTRPPGCLHTATIKQIGVGGADPLPVVGPVEPGANMNFELTSKQGAALITDHMTYREDIERKARTESYIKKHFDSWVDFAREQEHGDDVKPILVTGVDLTKKFASIAYADIKGSLRCNFSVGSPGSAALTAWGTWYADGLVHNNCGQSLVTQGNQSRGEGPSSQLVAGADHDQCVFIRYITIRKRFLIPMVLRAGAGAHQLPEGNVRDEDAEAMIIETSDDLAEVLPPSASSTHDAPLHNRDGFDVVAAFIFQRTDAKSVFFHDGDTEDLIRGSEEETIQFLEESAIIERVEIDQDGVAQLLPVARTDKIEVLNPFPDDVGARGNVQIQMQSDKVEPTDTTPNASSPLRSLGNPGKISDAPLTSSRVLRDPHWQVYNGELSSLGYGHALWDPSPLYNYERVRLGDVGYIRNGMFHLLFSAGIPLGPRVIGMDVPSTFTSLDVGPIVYRPTRAPGYLCSNTIEGTGTDDGGSLAYPTEPGTRMTFKLTGERGAILITKDRTYREDIQRVAPFEKYTKEHYSSWKAFAREAGHGDVNPVLVTGVDLTTQFAAMAYSGNRTEAVCEFRVNPPAVGLSSSHSWGSWHTQGRVHTNLGPERIPGPRLSSPPDSAVPDGHVQCVFIRYITVRKTLGLFPRLIKAGAGPHRLPKGGGGNDDAGALVAEISNPDGDMGSLDASPNVTQNTPPDNRDGFDIVAEFISQRTNATSVLLHHRDIQDLIRGSEAETIRYLEESSIIERVEIDENGVAQLMPVARPRENKVDVASPSHSFRTTAPGTKGLDHVLSALSTNVKTLNFAKETHGRFAFGSTSGLLSVPS